MATIEMVTHDIGGVRAEVNVSYPVGPGERNERNDVMLVQALLVIVANEDVVGFNEYFKPTDVPEITGIFDFKTQRAIWTYQRATTGVMRIDGKIHPGHYKNRVIKYGLFPMTITSLNEKAYIYGIFNNPSHIPSIVRQFAPHINYMKVTGGGLSSIANMDFSHMMR